MNVPVAFVTLISTFPISIVSIVLIVAPVDRTVALVKLLNSLFAAVRPEIVTSLAVMLAGTSVLSASE